MEIEEIFDRKTNQNRLERDFADNVRNRVVDRVYQRYVTGSGVTLEERVWRIRPRITKTGIHVDVFKAKEYQTHPRAGCLILPPVRSGGGGLPENLPPREVDSRCYEAGVTVYQILERELKNGILKPSR